MDEPVNEVEQVVYDLTTTPPLKQRRTIEKYFTQDAIFQHPFCRIGPFENSRYFIRAIFRWYKILSPHIDIKVFSISYDERNLLLYLGIRQTFRIWAVPFYKAPVKLTTVLQLRKDDDSGKYYIASQEDLYQVNEFVKFFWPGGFLLVWLWQTLATLMCVVMATLFWPISWLEQNTTAMDTLENLHEATEGVVDKVAGLVSAGHGQLSEKSSAAARGALVTDPAIEQR